MYEYKVAELREKMLGGKQSGGQLEAVLNEHGRQGWRVIAITRADIKGRLGLAPPRACSSPSSAS